MLESIKHTLSALADFGTLKKRDFYKVKIRTVITPSLFFGKEDLLTVVLQFFYGFLNVIQCQV